MRTIKAVIGILPAIVFCCSLANAEEAGKVFMIDDFDQKIMFNLLGGKTQGYEEAGVRCIPTFADDPQERHGDKGASLRLDFDVSKRESFSYYWTTLVIGEKAEGGDRNVKAVSFADLRDYDYLEFWLKDPKSGVEFIVEMHEDVDGDGVYTMGVDRISTVEVRQNIDRFTIGKWRKISIPLTRFSNIKDWSRILGIVFVFKNGYGTSKGVVYIDDLMFVKRFPR